MKTLTLKLILITCAAFLFCACDDLSTPCTGTQHRWGKWSAVEGERAEGVLSGYVLQHRQCETCGYTQEGF